MPQGWANWNNTENYKTTRYVEYNNYGPGAATVARLDWIKQLTGEQAAAYNIKNVLSGWNPEKNK